LYPGGNGVQAIYIEQEKSMATIQTKELTPDLWPELEKLFGRNGACGGCWCQAWRTAKGERWDDIKGTTAKKRLHRSVQDETVHGILAFLDGVPIGWCTFGPRTSFVKLDRAPSLKCADAGRVWSIPCFFVARNHRRQGVATALLRHALQALKQRKARIAEGYPVKPDQDGQYIAAFSWTGTRSLFQKAGFVVVGNRDGGKQRVRKQL
jgi:GNAT superfamily N-acetyltransferase